MRASRQQLAFAWSVLLPGDYFTALQSNVGAGSARWPVAMPAPHQGSTSSPMVQRRLGGRGAPLPGSALPVGTALAWERVCGRDAALRTELVAQSTQVWSAFADGTAPARRVVGLIRRRGDGYPPSRTVPVPDGPGLHSAPAGAFAFLPGDTPSLFTLRNPHHPCRDEDSCWVRSGPPGQWHLGCRHPLLPAPGDGQLIAPFPRSQGRGGSQPSAQPGSGATAPRFAKALITTCV